MLKIPQGFCVILLLQPLPGTRHIWVSGMDLKYIVDFAEQLHPISILWDLQTGLLQGYPVSSIPV